MAVKQGIRTMTKAEITRLIKRDIEENTGERTTLAAAGVWLDQECEAFYQVYAGTDPGWAVRTYSQVAAYLAGVWTGEDGDRLRAAMREHGVSLA